MVVRVERVVTIDAPRETVWAFIDDPERRANTISVVKSVESGPDGRAVWHVELPIPLIRKTVAIETWEQNRDPPSHVEFRGTSKVLTVVGEHLLEESNGGTTLTNRFTVDGKVPGVERYFKKQMGSELENLETALHAYLQREEKRNGGRTPGEAMDGRDSEDE